MLETVTQGFKNATERLRGVRELNDANIDEALRDVRTVAARGRRRPRRSPAPSSRRVKERSLGEKVETKVRDRAAGCSGSRRASTSSRSARRSSPS